MRRGITTMDENDARRSESVDYDDDYDDDHDDDDDHERDQERDHE